ncbi:C-reactive protein-like [Xenopus laevis]|uniref:Pentraxin family member n=2 Tax=Xenopus laevis TaxID=8355 RepID=Q6GN34_XENLA|nr:C-reactive protein-like [Xenopus laevis]AAH73686.1 MGC83053 protein [Xenopus laevis]OCT69020.1 hypothetical protein XELAEV_18040328mg [Xenopus laevis]
MKIYTLWIVFFAGSLAQEDLDNKVLVFPKESSTSYVILKPAVIKTLDKLSVCVRSFTDLSRSYPIFSVSSQGKQKALIVVITPSNTYNIHVFQETNIINTDASGLDWRHSCVTWDSTTGILQLWVNGKLYPRTVSRKGSIYSEKTIMILGNEQHSYGGTGFTVSGSFKGEISDVHVWDFVLSPDEVQRALFNNRNLNGNIINWRSLNYEIIGEVVVQPKLQCGSLELKTYALCYDEKSPAK